MIQTPLSYQHSLELLQSYAIPMAHARLVADPGQVVSAAREIGFPVALKLITPNFSHKSEAGLVMLNLMNASQVKRATIELIRRVNDQPNSLSVEGILVQEMVPNGVELIIGSNTDSQFGPVLLLGAGGIWVELLEDVALRLPPLTDQDAQGMIDEIRVSRILKGYRNHSLADLPALRILLLQVGRMLIEQSHCLDSLDLNPVIVLPVGQGVKVVDCRIYSR